MLQKGAVGPLLHVLGRAGRRGAAAPPFLAEFT